MSDEESVREAVDRAERNYGESIDYVALVDELRALGWERTP